MARPSENIEWAESADSSDIDEPTAARSGGYQFEQDIAHDEVNWQFRAIGRWLDYFDDLFQGVLEKLPLGSLDFGDNGSVEVGTDDASDHEIEHSHTGGGVSTLISDVFSAGSKVVTSVIERADQLSGDEIRFDSVNGMGTGFLNAANTPIAWGQVASNGTLLKGYGVDTSVENTNNYTITLDSSFDNVVVSPLMGDENTYDVIAVAANDTATSFIVTINDVSGTGRIKNAFSFIAF